MPSDERKDRRLGGLLFLFAGRGGGGAKPSLFLQFLPDLRHFRRRGVFQGSEDGLQVLDVGAGLGDLLFVPFLRRLQLVVFLEKALGVLRRGQMGFQGNGDRGSVRFVVIGDRHRVGPAFHLMHVSGEQFPPDPVGVRLFGFLRLSF